MLDEKTFYQYFYQLDEELNSERIRLENSIRKNPYNIAGIERLRDIRIILNQNQKIYNDLKGFYK